MRNERSWRLRHGLLGVGFALALVAAALGGTLAGPGAAAPKVKVVTVVEKEFSLTPSTRKLAAGKVTFVATNKGKFPHALAIKGPGLKTAKTAVLTPGSAARLTVTLKNGTYTMWCPVGTHASLGMKLALRVGSGAGTAASSPAPSSTSATSTTSSGGGSGGGGGWG